MALALGACGGSSTPSASSLIHDTFSSPHPIESGRVEASFSLSGAQSGGQHTPFSLRLQGPFQSAGGERLPEFALQLAFASTGNALRAGVASTDGRLYVQLGGSWFRAPEATVAELAQSYAQAAKGASSAGARASFATLGVDPGEWLVDPKVVGTTELAGAPTWHIVAGLNASRFMAAAAKVSASGGLLGLGGAGSAGPLSSTQLPTLAHALRSARVDLYTGTTDHLLRRLSVSAAVASTAQTRSTLGASAGAGLSFLLQFAEVNQRQTISPPANPQPLSQLGEALQRLGT